MKKIFGIFMAVALIVGVGSCKSGDDKASGSASAKASVEASASQAAPEAAPEVSLAELVDQAKKDGASWSVDQWKEHFTKILVAYKPFALDMQAILDKVGKGDANFDPEAEAAEVEKKYPRYGELLEEFTKAARATENGKKVLDDDEWGNAKMKELGIPDL